MRLNWKTVRSLSAAACVTCAVLAGIHISTLHTRIYELENQLEEVSAPTQVSPDAGVGRVKPKTEPSAEPEPEESAEPHPRSLGTFKLTAYCPCPKCCGEWADGLTYTETVATEGRTIAVDPDVIELGSIVTINGQEYVAEDIGGAIQGNRIDVYFSSHAEAIRFGVQYTEVLLNE